MDNRTNHYGFYAFFVFALAFILHMIVQNGIYVNTLIYPIFVIYLIGAVIGVIAWVKHYRGNRMGYANMILSGLSVMPVIIFLVLTIFILI